MNVYRTEKKFDGKVYQLYHSLAPKKHVAEVITVAKYKHSSVRTVRRYFEGKYFWDVYVR